MQRRLWAYLQLMRPANLVTAVADILLGYAASGAGAALVEQEVGWGTLGWLIVSTVCLYGGGVVLNDYFDAELDRTERPERPIPRGDATETGAQLLGGGLLLAGIVTAGQVSLLSAGLAMLICVLVVLYDAWGKHQSWFGPLNMGLCRGVNLLLGMSAIPAMLYERWYLALIPIVYIAAITMISRGEVHGENQPALRGGLALYGLVVLSILTLAFTEDSLYTVLFFVVLFGYLIFPPLLRALRDAAPQNIGKAVKAGVISLIVLDAALATVFAGWQYGLMVLILLPLSMGLGRLFAVT
ncbi:4-hydroxybenzoate polyprenyltransferase [Catalinimonas alkaloidigena]|uniref:4-hydroxybenzoate polyprenyltransferase n=1 Tax=Catalinimonas alkaloidigena TaxID=1075417 RepID=A0A1G9G8W4_9BACT|nr:UbiA-like protein EboC [Catalinimonas alkaloidigena]SDK97164.1 4-hydroxybenzoate polyprenyltransferase [Catalinimonas alkaloidigena]